MEDIKKRHFKHSEETKKKISLAMKGKPRPPEVRKKISLGLLGNKIWLGKHHGEAAKQKCRLANLNEKNPHWKGDNVGLHALHIWVRSRLPQPKLCQFCNVNKSKDLACITGLYNRQLHNWKYLCRSCHMIHDYATGMLKPRDTRRIR